MYINDYVFKDNKITNENLSNKEIFIHDEAFKKRLEEIVEHKRFGQLIGTLCNVDDYIHVVDYKNTPKKLDIFIEDKNDDKIVIELPYEKSKNKYRIIEKNLVREYNIDFNKQDIDISLSSIEFKKDNKSFKKKLSFENHNNYIKINDYLGFINLDSKDNIEEDEEKIKDLILSLDETPTTEELYLKVKNTLSKKYESVQILYKKVLADIDSKPDEITEQNGKITKFLVTRNDKQYDLTNEIIINQLHTKK